YTVYAGSSLINRTSVNAFAGLLDYYAHRGGVIRATDPFFQLNRDLGVMMGSTCIPFVKQDGSFDPTGVNSLFRNQNGYIQLIVGKTEFNKLIYTLSFYSGSSAYSFSCNNRSSDDVCTAPGDFKVIYDEGTGNLVIRPIVSSCSLGSCGVVITCLPICPGPTSKITNVIAANAQTYDLTWPCDTTLYKPRVGANTFESGVKGKWRTLSNYIYRDTIIPANSGGERNYLNAGVFEMDGFNWQNPSLLDASLNAKWIKTNTVTRYSPDGNAMEEKDIFGIYSSAKFGYNKTQPYIVAKNAEYYAVQFESFEKSYNVYGAAELEDGWRPTGISTKRTSVTAHAGKYSWLLTANDSLQLKPLTLTQQMIDKGVSLKVWVNDTALTEGTALKGRLKMTGTTVNYPVIKIANVGSWALYEMKATNLSAFYAGALVTPVIVNNYASKTIWVDDVRFQPLDAAAIAYVYDINTLRLIATFDDQHFGMFYQYNGEGKLVRKQIETERGIKTITETQYHSAQQKVR
ncbi:MAG TPA: hypothetical protein VFF27_12285, partial [Bacteroidia bacterium]|nr:hypothetical protein [Bacteroidia bacterium]